MTWFLSDDIYTDNIENYAWVEDAWTDEDIQKIIDLGLSLEEQPGTIGAEAENVDGAVRKSKVSWITPTPDSEWLFRRLVDLIKHINGKFFHFDLVGMLESLQFTMYRGEGSHYRKHTDKVMNSNARKLSLVVQLSDPEDYEGGDLEIYTGHEPLVVKKKKGMTAFFPSYQLHGVTPVTKGTRYSLVVWVHGPAFR